MTAFHDKFDDATQLKLDLFRGYIREWLPVFLTKYSGNRQNYTRVNIYDFFAGPGQDANGNPGSPRIIVDELKQFWQANSALKASNVDVRLVFNDVDSNHISQLESVIGQVEYPECCRIEYSSLPFQEALQQYLPNIQHPDTANLIIMDQFGVTEVTPDVIRQLADCKTTDILFFISSSFIKRFIETPELGGKFDMDADEVKTVDYNAIHQYICRHFQEKLQDRKYYLAPFSIKKKSNIYGVIFGSSNLLGLDKFLKVCWKKDSVTGEANYNIDGDFAWAGNPLLFDELNVIQKVDLFEQELKEFIENQSPDNRELYEFSLLHGFSTTKAKETLASLQNNDKLIVTDIETGKPVRKGAFYVHQDGYKAPPRVKFSLKDTK